MKIKKHMSSLKNKSSFQPNLPASRCMFGFDGLSVPDWIRRLINQEGLWGVILFKRNIESKEQLKTLIGELKALRPASPVYVGVDHEGGRVFRLPEPFTKTPTAREIGRQLEGSAEEGHPFLLQDDTNLAFQTGLLMGHELKEVGFDIDFAPVLDVDSNPLNPIIGDRAYSADPLQVGPIALEVARGLRTAGIIPCGKHFPGYGDTFKDSHLELPVVDRGLEPLEQVELLPFRQAANAGLEMFMTAHVLYPAWDEAFPATLSRKILTGLLREKMGYQGLIISDDLNMQAIATAYGIPQAARMFFEAGGDVALVCRYEEVCVAVVEEMKSLL